MSQLRRPPPARVLVRASAEDDSQTEADQRIFFNDLEHPQHSKYESNWTTRPFYFFPATRYLLNNLTSPSHVETPLLPYTIPARNRSNDARDCQPRIQSHHASENHNENNKADNTTASSTFDIRTDEHKCRIKDLKEKLKCIFPENGSAMVLMCWGKPSHCSILPVRVSSPEDEVTTWSEINKAWYNRRGSWRRIIPGLRVARADSVELSILGLKDAMRKAEECEYVGGFSHRDIALERRRLEDIIDNCDVTSDCVYNCYTDTADCGYDCTCDECIPGLADGACPAKVLRDTRRKLSLLTTPATMKHVFSSPSLAASNDFLKNEHLVYSHRDILSCFNTWYISHRPSLIELQFTGIFIEEGWILERRLVFSLLAAISLVVVIAAHFVFGWDTAWTVGGFFVALLSLWTLASSIVD